jgi:citrate synthase
MSDVTYSRGLEGVVAGETSICRIDGKAGKLYYRGYSIDELAEKSSFEEVSYLLLYEKLPNKRELEDFTVKMRKSRHIAPEIIDMIRQFPPKGKPMELLQSVMSYLSGYVEHVIEHSATCNCRITLHQIAQLATVTAAYKRIQEGEDYVEPDESLNHGANFLYMLRGTKPDEYEGKIMDTCFLLHAEHEFNASTFTARVVASTLSTCYSSISAAIGALRGSLHGGANEAVLKMLDEIGSVENVENWTRKALSEKRLIMGMGHREYKAMDPRAVIMKKMLEELVEKKKNDRNYRMLLKLNDIVRKHMDDIGKPIYPNVDFFSGSVYSLLDIPNDLFTPIFAAARVSGWLAHVLEQREHHNRIFRPEAIYRGPQELQYVPIAQRS